MMLVFVIYDDANNYSDDGGNDNDNDDNNNIVRLPSTLIYIKKAIVGAVVNRDHRDAKNSVQLDRH